MYLSKCIAVLMCLIFKLLYVSLKNKNIYIWFDELFLLREKRKKREREIKAQRGNRI